MNKKYIDVTIEEGKTAYEAVAKYIRRFWDNEQSFYGMIVRLSTSYNNVEWRTFNTLALFDIDEFDIVFENDWWEGERFIRLYGIVSVDDVDVSGGLYPD